MYNYLHLPVASTAYHGARTAIGVASCGHCDSSGKEIARTVQHAAQDLWLLSGTVLLYALCQTKQVQPYFQRTISSLKNMESYQTLSKLIQSKPLALKCVSDIGKLMNLGTANTRNLFITGEILIGTSVLTYVAQRAAQPA